MKIFRIIATATMLLFFALQVTAQSRDFNKLVTKLEADFALTSLTLSGNTVKLFNSFDFDGKDEVGPLLDDLENMRLTLSGNNAGVSFFRRAAEEFVAAGYEEIDVRSRAKGHNVKLFALRSGLTVREAHVVNADGQVAIFSVFGKFKLRDIRRLISINE